MSTMPVEFRCGDCGTLHAMWVARCTSCDQYNVRRMIQGSIESTQATANAAWKAILPTIHGRERITTVPASIPVTEEEAATPVAIGDVRANLEALRLSTGIAELDRVLGGGIAPSSIILLAGSPGAGKSTILIQALSNLAGERDVLYASGEESLEQIALRGRRVDATALRLSLVAESNIDRILALADKSRPAILTIDSIQTVRTNACEAAPGSVAQIRECAQRINDWAKRTGTPTFLIGHVTKDGDIGGPKTLEHLVDVVLNLEMADSGLRFLRSPKNRYGSTMEMGVFRMDAGGIVGVDNPSAQFLADRSDSASGSVAVAAMDGARSLLVEVQALVTRTTMGGDDAPGKSIGVGVGAGRLALLRAVIEKHTDLDLHGRDVFVSIAGGLKLGEPAVDLALALAIASSHADIVIDPGVIVFGEVGLTGELRSVPMAAERLAEAARLGFTRAIVPRHVAATIDKAKLGAIEIVGAGRLADAIAAIRGDGPSGVPNRNAPDRGPNNGERMPWES